MRTYRITTVGSIFIAAILIASLFFPIDWAQAATTRPHSAVGLHHHITHRPRVTVSQQEMAAWSKVAQCEQGGNWHVIGSVYSGGLGILNINWEYYGGLAFAPNAGLATPAEQITIAERIQSNPPDQWGCDGAW